MTHNICFLKPQYTGQLSVQLVAATVGDRDSWLAIAVHADPSRLCLMESDTAEKRLYDCMLFQCSIPISSTLSCTENQILEHQIYTTITRYGVKYIIRLCLLFNVQSRFSVHFHNFGCLTTALRLFREVHY